MKYKIKNGTDKIIEKVYTLSNREKIKNKLDIAYQNDDNVKNLIMQKLDYGTYGCFATAFRNVVNYILTTNSMIKQPIPKDFLNMVYWDKILDNYECWSNDGLIAPNVISGVNREFITRLQHISGVKLIYKRIERSQIEYNTIKEIVDHIKDDYPIIIEVDNLYQKGRHFINVDRVDFNNSYSKVLLAMSETYKNYNGYDTYDRISKDNRYFCDVTYPYSFRLIKLENV